MIIERVNQFHAAEGKSDDLKQFFIELVDYIKQSAGNISCRLLVNEQAPEQFVIIEQWQSKAAHQASLADYPAEKMQAAMAYFAKPPTGSFYQLVKE